MNNLLHPKTNYSILTESNLIFSYIANYILKLNEDFGIYPYKTVFNPYIIISDTEKPLDRQFVISQVERPEPFIILDIQYKLYQIIYQMLEIENKEFKDTYESLSSSWTQVEKFTFAFSLYHIFKSGMDISNPIFTTNIRATNQNKTKLTTLINFLNIPNKQNMTSLAQAYFNESQDFPILVNIITKLLDDDGSIKKISATGEVFVRNLLKLAMILSKSSTSDEALLGLCNYVREVS